MLSNSPDVAAFHKGGFLQSGGQIKFVILDFLVRTAFVGFLLFIGTKAEKLVIKSGILQIG